MLISPDQRTTEALKRLSPDADFQEIVAWLTACMHELDARNRTQLDGVILRMNQGGSQTLSELLDHASGRSRVKAQPVATSNA